MDRFLVIIIVISLLLVVIAAVMAMRQHRKDTALIDSVQEASVRKSQEEVSAYDIFPPQPFYYDRIPVNPLYGYYFGGGSHGGRHGSYHTGCH
jgi:hypothetical protein